MVTWERAYSPKGIDLKEFDDVAEDAFLVNKLDIPGSTAYIDTKRKPFIRLIYASQERSPPCLTTFTLNSY